MGDRDTWTGERGIEVALRRFSPFLRDKVRASVPFPDVPTYEVETAGGGSETHRHEVLAGEDGEVKSTTLQTDEDREAWAEYEAARAVATGRLYERLAKLALTRGVAVEIPDDGWVKEQEFLGVEIPEGQTERQMHYIQTEVVTSNEELANLVLAALRYQGVNPEEVDSAEDTFCADVEGSATEGSMDEAGGVDGE